MCLPTVPKHHFEPRDPHWADKVRASFSRQGAMELIGAELDDIQPGWCEICMPYRHDLTQQHGYFHADITTTGGDSAAGDAVGRACDSSDHARSLRNDAAGTILYSAEKAIWMAGEALNAPIAPTNFGIFRM
jgi:hypothetical protein